MENPSLAPELAKEDELSKIKALHRKERRRKLSIRHRGIMRPSFQARSGLPTGTTPHFKMWMADLKMMSALQRTRLLDLAEASKSPGAASAYMLCYKHGFRNVFELTRADAPEMQDVAGLGPVRLSTLKADLAKANVAVAW